MSAADTFAEAFGRLQTFAAADLDHLEREARRDPEAFCQFAKLVCIVERHIVALTSTWNPAAEKFNALAERLGRPDRVH